MKQRIIYKIIVLLLLFIFSIIPFFVNKECIRGYLVFNYGINIVFLVIYVYLESNRISVFLSPVFLTLLYLNINFFIGSWAYNEGYIYYPNWIKDYNSFKHLGVITFYFNLSNIFLLLSYEAARNRFFLLRINYNTLKVSNKSGLIIIFINALLLFLLSKINLDLSIIGGTGDFSIAPKSIIAIILFLLIKKRFNKLRIFYYLIVLFFFVIASYDNKRDAIFLVLPILLIELLDKRIYYNIKTFFITLIPLSIIVYFILLMSIARGYGQYPVSGVIESTKYVDDYIKTDEFIIYFMNNIEVSSTTYNSMHAIEIILEQPNLMTYGETIIKFLFAPIPRKYFTHKPRSMVDIYTMISDPEFRKEGNSYPIVIQSEAFWNFHFMGLVFLFFLYFISSIFYNTLLKQLKYRLLSGVNVVLLYGYTIFLYIPRGNGIGDFVIYFTIGFLFYVLLKLIFISVSVRFK